MPQPFLGSSLQSVPLAEIAPPLEAACYPAVIHRRARVHSMGRITPGFTDSHAFTQSPGSPNG